MEAHRAKEALSYMRWWIYPVIAVVFAYLYLLKALPQWISQGDKPKP